MKRHLFAAAALLCGLLSAQGNEPAPAGKPAPAQEPKLVHKAALYPIDTCIASNEPLDKDAVTFEANGTTFKTCCDKCKAKVEADVATFQKKLDEASKNAQLAHYPLAVCTVSGEELGSMGAPVQLMLEGTLVQLCCKSCTKKALAKPADMIAKVKKAAYEQQKKTVNDVCPVGGEKIGDDKVDVMFGTTLIRFCCEKCAAKFEQEPAKYAANVKHTEKAEGDHGQDKAKDEKPKDGEHKGHD
ncbi:MAG: hypothetical protein ABL997_19880 [Planctomycetota bacterium]